MEYPLKINIVIDFNNGEMVSVNCTDDEAVLDTVRVRKSTDGKKPEFELWTHMGMLKD